MKLITTTQAANKIGVTSQTIRNWIDRGIIEAKKVGDIFYVRADTIESLLDFEGDDDIHAIIASLDEEKKAYAEERDSYRAMREDMRFEKERTRYLYVAINSGVKTGFFESIIGILMLTENLNEREAYILSRALRNDSYSEMADELGLTRERLRQLAEKCIRKCRELNTLAEKIKTIPELQKENTSLRTELERLKEFIAKKNPEATKIVEESKLDKLIKLLNTKITDCGLSVRSVNCLHTGYEEYHFDVETKKSGYIQTVPACNTVGDICRLKRTDLFKIRNMGKVSIIEITDFLENNGLSFEMDVDAIYRQKALTK